MSETCQKTNYKLMSKTWQEKNKTIRHKTIHLYLNHDCKSLFIQSCLQHVKKDSKYLFMSEL
jgi:hypothetical protein